MHTMIRSSSTWLSLVALVLAGCQTTPPRQVGPLPDGGHLAPTDQLLRPAGESVEFGGRPVDLVLAPDGRTAWIKDNRGLVAITTANWSVRQELKFKESGGSTHGLWMTRDGTRLFASGAANALWEALIDAQGVATWGRKIVLPGPGGKGNPQVAGVALSRDETRAYVCLSRNNTLAVVDLVSGTVERQIPVGVAPYDVVLAGDEVTETRAFVSNWGGRHPAATEPRADSSGTATLVDARGVAASGTVSVVDLREGKETAQIATGLHPSDLELSADGRWLYVANANSDSVTVVDATTRAVAAEVSVRPDHALPFGSAPNALSLSPDGRRLYVANGGNNAVAVLSVAHPAAPRVEGFIPTGWYPGALAIDGTRLHVANVKGIGSRSPDPKKLGWNSHQHRGSVSRVAFPTPDRLAEYTRQVQADARVPEILRAWERSRASRRPVPVPRQLGDPSVFEHLVYVIKENRTYDQVLGDLPQGNGEPSLCLFGREVTPNHHALAERYVLLDNFYCNGILSADGHAWATEGYATDYLEKSFGGFTRSYPYSGDDPLRFAPTGFLWDNALLHGLSFRNYGEMSKTTPVPAGASFEAILSDSQARSGKISFRHEFWIDTLKRFSCPDSPGWNMRIPDQIRADVFLQELRTFEEQERWPNLMIVYLPSDHTSGTRPGNPTPRAQVADNDLALGRIVEGISRSRFWPKTCIFVVEDDPQAGFDHVDGHRSPCLVISPYTKRGVVISEFYNQTSVLHTMQRILGLPPMNQMDARSPLMTDCFTAQPDFAPFPCLPTTVPLDEMNPAAAGLTGAERHWANLSQALPLDEPDRADEDTLNRILWHAVKGVGAPYPAAVAGAHGKGLKGLGLRLVSGPADDDGD
jgi:YVTN family beta-propeller protein